MVTKVISGKRRAHRGKLNTAVDSNLQRMRHALQWWYSEGGWVGGGRGGRGGLEFRGRGLRPLQDPPPLDQGPVSLLKPSKISAGTLVDLLYNRVTVEAVDCSKNHTGSAPMISVRDDANDA